MTDSTTASWHGLPAHALLYSATSAGTPAKKGGAQRSVKNSPAQKNASLLLIRPGTVENRGVPRFMGKMPMPRGCHRIRHAPFLLSLWPSSCLRDFVVHFALRFPFLVFPICENLCPICGQISPHAFSWRLGNLAFITSAHVRRLLSDSSFVRQLTDMKTAPRASAREIVDAWDVRWPMEGTLS